MGIGTLRRYHARPDNGLVTDTAAPSATGAHDVPAVHEAKAEWERVSADTAAKTEAVTQIRTSLLETHGGTLDGLSDADQERLDAAEAAAVEAHDAEEAAKIAYETALHDAEEAAKAQEKEQAVIDRQKHLEASPGHNGKKDAWTEYALANGKSEDDLKGLGRDAIAELFLGPKE